MSATQGVDVVLPPTADLQGGSVVTNITKFAITTTASAVKDLGEGYQGYIRFKADVAFGIIFGKSSADLTNAPLIAATDASNPDQRCEDFAADVPVHLKPGQFSRYYRVVGGGSGTFQLVKG